MLADRLNYIKSKILAAHAKRLKNANSPAAKLIAVSKNVDADIIEQAILSGQTEFAENKVQEALNKWPKLKETYPHIKLHLIGALQTNKAKLAVDLFDTIQTVDRIKLAEILANEAEKQNKQLNYYAQVNIGQEPQKAGVDPQELTSFITNCRQNIGLPITGLMCIPPAEMNPAPYFYLTAKLAKSHNCTNLSMGMSGDFAEAIKFGATEIRIGTAIFGTR